MHRFFRIARAHSSRPFFEWQSGDPGGEKGALVRRSLTYGETGEAILLRAREFSRLLPPGPVILALPPGPEFVVGELALMLSGRLPLLLDHLLPAEGVGEVADLFSAAAILCPIDLYKALERPPLLHLSPEIPPLSGDLPDPSDLLDRALPEGAGTIAHLLLTSGTTGRPKGVPLTHRNLLANADAVLSRGVYTDGDRVLSVLPLHHSYPYMVTLLLPLSVGGTVIFAPDLSPGTLREILAKDRITLFPAVPVLWEGFHKRIREEIDRRPPAMSALIRNGLIPFSFYLRQTFGINVGKIVFASFGRRFGKDMKALASGGAALRSEIARDFIAMGLVMLEGYGLTETSPVVSMTTPEDLAVGTVGHPLPGVELRVLAPEEGRPGGRVLVRGESVAECWWTGKEERVPLRDADGWFDTGDLGVLSEGRLRLVGREKEVIVLPSGKNIFAEPLERRLGLFPGVAEAAVLLEGKALVVLFRPDPSAPASLEEIASQVDAVNRESPSHSRISAFETIFDPLPRTRLGKLRRFLLPELYRMARALRLERKKVVGRSFDSPLLARVREAIARVSGEGVPVVDEARLEADLGLDSLLRIELLQEVEEILGRSVPDDLLLGVLTVGDLLGRLSSLAGVGKSPGEEILLRPLSPGEEARIPDRGRTLRKLSIGERLLYHLFRGVGRIFFRIRWPRWRQEGEAFLLERAPDEGKEAQEEVRIVPGPFVIVANHGSYLDGPLLALMLPPPLLSRTLFWGFAPLFDGPLAPFKNLFGIVSIAPDSALSGLRVALRLLLSGRGLGVFPEGERSTDGRIAPFRPGVGVILSRMKVPVLPVGIAGTFEAFPPHRALPRPGRVSFCPGEMIRPSDLSGLSDHEIARLLEERVRQTLCP
ncbi:MAG: AMP-binding protein [Leptospirales bacterium]